jgi:CRISPR-associated exonuclease Cas4
MDLSTYWGIRDVLYHSFTNMIAIFFFGILIIFLGFGLLIILQRQQRQLGSLASDLVYMDSSTTPGDVIEAKTLLLRGKPDAIRKEQDYYIPIEVKTGKTPHDPHVNHTMQLMAYCLLMQEHYGVRPPGGIIKYPEKEFKVAYTQEAEKAVRDLVAEITQQKKAGTEFTCTHPEHQVAAT